MTPLQPTALRTVQAVLCLLALLASPASALAYEAKDCDQDEVASLGLRACSALLEKSDLSREDRTRFLVRRGNAWLREEEPDQAVTDFTRALELAPDNKDALKGRARANTVLGRHEAAAADFAALIGEAGVSPQTAPLYFDHAASLIASGKNEAALINYDKILAAEPNSINARIGRARVFTALKDRDKALAEFEAALKVDPKDSAIFFARAEAAEAFGEKAAAIADYRKFIELNNRKGWVAIQALRRLGAE